MRLIKIIFIFIFFIIGLYLLACLFIPSKYKVERSLEIEAPIDIVYEKIIYYENWESWNPWTHKDPDTKTLFGPKDGVIGSYWLWKSNKEGEGRMTTVKIENQSQLDFILSFKSPFEAETKGYLKVSPQGQKTIVTWVTEGENVFYKRPINLLMDRKIGPFFKLGLDSLKSVSEEYARFFQEQYFGYRIEEKEFKGGKLAFIRKSILFEDVDDFFKTNQQKIVQESRNCNYSIEGNLMSLYYFKDEINGLENIAVAIPVMGDSILGPDAGIMIMQSKKALLLNYFGGYKSSENAYKALDNYIKNNSLKLKKPIIEEFVTGPKEQKDSNLWHTRIWYLLE